MTAPCARRRVPLLAACLCGAVAGISSAEEVVAPAEPPLVHVRRVAIDPGHGGSDPGCVGVLGLAEKELTLKVARRLRAHLEERSDAPAVLLTREADAYPTLEERTRAANAFDADVLISIHFNCATNAAALGLETFYLDPLGTVPCDIVPGNEASGPECPDAAVTVAGATERAVVEDLVRTAAGWWSAALAEDVQAALVRSTSMSSRGVKQAQFRVLRGARMPAVVVELGFLTHPVEGKRVVGAGRIDEYVDGLVRGLEAFDGRGN